VLCLEPALPGWFCFRHRFHEKGLPPMLNLAISLAVYGLTILALFFAGVDILISSLVALLVFAGAFFLLSRRIIKKLTAVMETVQHEVQAGRTEKAVKTLQNSYDLGNWQFFVKSQISAQIGTILYLKRDFAHAFDYLQKAFSRHWVAMGMLGICYMKRNNPKKMIETFEKATAVSKKESMLWSLYAYCLERVGQKEKAIAVLEKGINKGAADDCLLANLESLKTGKKMKMKGYGDLWLQFHLEKPGTLIKQQTKAVQGRRKIVRR
jgi:tetratricopeptide (TPR) repeat protein